MSDTAAPYQLDAAPHGDVATWVVSCPAHGPIGRIGQLSNTARDRRAAELAEIHAEHCDPAGPPPANYGVAWEGGQVDGLTYEQARTYPLTELTVEQRLGAIIVMPPRPRHMTLVGQREGATGRTARWAVPAAQPEPTVSAPATRKPTAAQAAVLRRAAAREDGMASGGGVVVRRNLLDAGWVASVRVDLPLVNRGRGTTTTYQTSRLIITDAGRAAIGAPAAPGAAAAGVVDLDQATTDPTTDTTGE